MTLGGGGGGGGARKRRKKKRKKRRKRRRNKFKGTKKTQNLNFRTFLDELLTLEHQYGARWGGGTFSIDIHTSPGPALTHKQCDTDPIIYQKFLFKCDFLER